MSRRRKPYDASDPAQVAQAERHNRNTAERDRDDLRWVMSDARGRRFLHRLVHKDCHLLDNMFTGNSATFFNEGARQVGVRLLARAKDADQTLFAKLTMENIDD